MPSSPVAKPLSTAPDRPPVIGLVGGIASGKSYVARHWQQAGAALIDADQLAHAVLRQPEVLAAAAEHWGKQILGGDGQIDRSRLASIVFDPSPAGIRELAWLEGLTHPRIGALAAGQIADLLARDEIPAIVVDAPLLIEAGWNGFCDRIVYVEAPRDVRLTRALARGWSPEDFSRREARQKSLEEKRELADVVIDTSGSPESTRAQMERAWDHLARPARPR